MHSEIEALAFVGTNSVSGKLQLELLKMQGLKPHHKLLEIGCGCLHGAIPIMGYLDESHYFGIEPNEWLIEVAMRNPDTKHMVDNKKPKFSHREDFDASEFGVLFDCIFSHSVLSHCAHWQMKKYLCNTLRVLHAEGFILASLRLAEGNKYGSKGSHDKLDSMDEEWQYPDVSYFTMKTLRRECQSLGLSCDFLPDCTEFYTKSKPDEFHDWIVLRRIANG